MKIPCWKESIFKEVRGLYDGCFTLVPNVGQRVLGTRYVFVVKDDTARTFKSRMVIKGFSQREGEDYDVYKISSGVAGSDTVRVLLALAHARDFHLSVQDISQAFLYAHRDKDRPVYIKVREPSYLE